MNGLIGSLMYFDQFDGRETLICCLRVLCLLIIIDNKRGNMREKRGRETLCVVVVVWLCKNWKIGILWICDLSDIDLVSWWCLWFIILYSLFNLKCGFFSSTLYFLCSTFFTVFCVDVVLQSSYIRVQPVFVCLVQSCLQIESDIVSAHSFVCCL